MNPLLQMLQPAGGAGPDDPSGPLPAVQEVIQDLHHLIAVLPDPGHTRIAAQCLTALTGVQADLMRQPGK